MTPDTPFVVFAIAGSLLMAAGVAMLRRRWLARRQHGAVYLMSGWLAILASFAAFAEAWNAEMGTTYAFGALALVAYAVIAATYERRRPGKMRDAREASLDPEDRPTNWRRGVGQALLAVVLAGVASIGIGVALAIHLPLPPQDRAVIGGLLVPVFWGAGMAWTLSDPRLLRATAILIFVSAIGYGAAFLPKVLT